MREYKNYSKVIIPGLAVNIAAGIILETSKAWIESEDYGIALFIFGIIVVNLIYSIVLVTYTRKIERDKFVDRTNIHHSFAHTARNIAVKLMKRKQSLPINGDSITPIALSGELHYSYEGDIVLLLRSLADMFSKLVPEGTKVWTCLRERRSDDNYYTIMRAGNFSPTRIEFSSPLSKDSKTLENLRHSYEHKMDCVIITGSSTEDKGWESMRNDDLGEDLSVLMGAVLSKSWNGRKFDDPMLNWVLCVCADKEKVFNDSHIPLMKCFNDIFSWLLNSFIRHDAIQNEEGSKANE